MTKALTVVFLVLYSLSAHSQLTEFDVLQLGLENPHFKERLRAQKDKARGELQSAGRWDNPEVEYSRETLDLSEGNSEESTMWVSQTINIAGVKSLERKAAAFAYDAQEHKQAMTRRQWQKILREEFYLTLAAQRNLFAHKQLEAELQKLVNIVNRRTKSGDASQLDALRIEKELALVTSQRASTETRYIRLHNALFSRLNASPQSLQGSLLPTEPVSETIQWESHPEIQAMQTMQKSAEVNARAAGREAWPEITLGMGRKEVNEPDMVADGNFDLI